MFGHSFKMIVVAALFMALCAPVRVRAADPYCEKFHADQIHDYIDAALLRQELQDILQEKMRSAQLLEEPACMRSILKQPELRQEILRHPRFVRQLMQRREMRLELLQSEQMMHEMLHNREIHDEITRNREMMEEIEKNAEYRRENLERQADILEKLLLEPAVSGGALPGSN